MKFFNLDSIIASGNAAAAARLIPFFYYFMLFIAFQSLEGLDQTISSPRGELIPRWPIFWSSYTDYAAAASIVVIFFVVASLLSAIFYRELIFRALAFLGMFQFHAFNSSFGTPNHQWDLWLWVSLIFIFFPNIWKGVATAAAKKKFLLVFWTAQAYLLLTYTMSGIGKIYGSIGEIAAGQASVFSFDAAALHVSSLLYSLQQSAPLGAFIVNYPLLGWLPFVGIVFFQLFSIYAAFKPSLHRIWGVGLILFHLGTYLAMRAIFVSPVALILILLLSSPFPARPWKKSLLDLPILGWAARLVMKKFLR